VSDSYPCRVGRLRHIRGAAVALALAGALVAPASAAADDQSIYNAWHTSHPRFKQLRQDFEKGERHWENSGYKDPDAAYKACRSTVALAKNVNARMAKKTTSSAPGAEARTHATKGLDDRRRWADSERRAIEAFMRFDGDGYLRLHRKAKKYIGRAQDHEDAARKLWKQAGVNPNPTPGGPQPR
jgi:hypothetical protein